MRVVVTTVLPCARVATVNDLEEEPMERDTDGATAPAPITLSESALELLSDDLVISFATSCAESVREKFEDRFPGDTRADDAIALLRRVVSGETELASTREFAAATVALVTDRAGLDYLPAMAIFAAMNAAYGAYGNEYLPQSRIPITSWAMAAAASSSLEDDHETFDVDALALQYDNYQELLDQAASR